MKEIPIHKSEIDGMRKEFREAAWRYDCAECSPILSYDPHHVPASELTLEVPEEYKSFTTDITFVGPYYSYNICKPFILCPTSAKALWIRIFVVAEDGQKLLGDAYTNNPEEIEHQPNLGELLGVTCNKTAGKWLNFGEPIKSVGCMMSFREG